MSDVMQALYSGRRDEAARLAAGRTLAWHEAAAMGDLDQVRGLLAEGARVDERAADGFTALHLAAFFGHEDVAGVLLKNGADANAVADNPSKVRPLHSAVAAAAEAIAAALLDAGAEADAAQHGGWTALMSAAKHGHAGLVRRLVAAGADPDTEADDGQTARTLAAPEVFDLLG